MFLVICYSSSSSSEWNLSSLRYPPLESLPLNYLLKGQDSPPRLRHCLRSMVRDPHNDRPCPSGLRLEGAIPSHNQCLRGVCACHQKSDNLADDNVGGLITRTTGCNPHLARRTRGIRWSTKTPQHQLPRYNRRNGRTIQANVVEVEKSNTSRGTKFVLEPDDFTAQTAAQGAHPLRVGCGFRREERKRGEPVVPRGVQPSETCGTWWSWLAGRDCRKSLVEVSLFRSVALCEKIVKIIFIVTERGLLKRTTLRHSLAFYNEVPRKSFVKAIHKILYKKEYPNKA